MMLNWILKKEILKHVRLCEGCKTKVEVYRLLVTGIKQQPQPAFDFDLSATVLQQLPLLKEKTSDRTLLWALIFIGVVFVGLIGYYFQHSFAYLFEGISAIFIYLIVISVVTVLAGLFIDMYKKYNKEMKLLDSFWSFATFCPGSRLITIKIKRWKN